MSLGIVGVIFGGLTALGTHNAKRMLAYSTLAQIGFILVGIGWGTPIALAAAIVLTVNHSLIKAAMLMLAGAVASRAPIKSAAFANITGVGKSLPFLGALFLLGGLALAGIPPTNGFVGKMALFRSGVMGEEYLSLAAIGVASILTLVYVVRAFQTIWWVAPAGGGQSQTGRRSTAGAGAADRLVSAAGGVGRASAAPGQRCQRVAGQPVAVHHRGVEVTTSAGGSVVMHYIRTILILLAIYLALTGNLQFSNIVLGTLVAAVAAVLLRPQPGRTDLRRLPAAAWAIVRYVAILAV